MMWFYAFSKNFISFLECYILCCTYSLFFERRLSKWKHAGACVLGGLVLMLMLDFLNSLALFSFLTVAAVVIASSSLALLIYRANWVQTLSVSVVYFVLILAYDFLVISVVELLYQVDNFTMTILTEVGPARTVYIWFQKISLVTVYLLLAWRNKGRRVQLSSRVSLALIASGTFCFFFMQYLINAILIGDVAEIKKSVLIAWLFILLFFAGVWVLVAAYSKMETQRIEKDAAASKAAALEENSMRLNQAYSEIAKVSHDFRNHLRTMSTMAGDGQYEELRDYLQTLTKEQPPVRMRMYTGVEIVDAVLNNKAHEAQAQQVQLSINARYPANAKIRSVDICALLVNLLDNALEASAKIPDPEKRLVEIRIAPVNAMLMIVVKNTVAENAKLPGAGQNVTIKADKHVHGYGLKIVRSVLARYKGHMEQTCADGFFTTNLLMNNMKPLDLDIEQPSLRKTKEPHLV